LNKNSIHVHISGIYAEKDFRFEFLQTLGLLLGTAFLTYFIGEWLPVRNKAYWCLSKERVILLLSVITCAG
jgi:hypothetical protein